MKLIGISLIYVGFYGLIAVASWATQSAWPLLALVFTPRVRFGGKTEEEKTP